MENQNTGQYLLYDSFYLRMEVGRYKYVYLQRAEIGE